MTRRGPSPGRRIAALALALAFAAGETRADDPGAGTTLTDAAGDPGAGSAAPAQPVTPAEVAACRAEPEIRVLRGCAGRITAAARAEIRARIAGIAAPPGSSEDERDFYYAIQWRVHRLQRAWSANRDGGCEPDLAKLSAREILAPDILRWHALCVMDVTLARRDDIDGIIAHEIERHTARSEPEEPPAQPHGLPRVYCERDGCDPFEPYRAPEFSYPVLRRGGEDVSDIPIE